MKIIKNKARESIKSIMYRSLTNIFGSTDGMVLLPVLRGPARGLRFKLDLLERKESTYFSGSYDLSILKKLALIIKPGWTIWDCGGYMGFYSAFFAKYAGPKARIVVFEPDPRNMKRLKENMAINNIHNVQYVLDAIGAARGQTEFILSNNSNSHLPGTYVGATKDEYAKIEKIDRTITVNCISLQQAYLDKDIPKPDFIKIDIDGSEIDALENAGLLIKEVNPLILLELHNPDTAVAAWKFAQDYSYRLQFFPGGKIVQKAEEVEGTFLCIPEKQETL